MSREALNPSREGFIEGEKETPKGALGGLAGDVYRQGRGKEIYTFF